VEIVQVLGEKPDVSGCVHREEGICLRWNATGPVGGGVEDECQAILILVDWLSKEIDEVTGEHFAKAEGIDV